MNALNIVSYSPFAKAALQSRPAVGKPAFAGIPRSAPADEVYFRGPGRYGQIDEFYTIDDFIILPF